MGDASLSGDLLELCPLPTLALTKQGQVCKINRSARSLLGLRESALPDSFEWVHPQDRNKLPRSLDDLEGADQCVIRILDECDTWRFARIHLTSYSDCIILSLSVDNILTSEESSIDVNLLVRAINASNNSIVVADVRQEDDPLIYVNQGFLDLTGYNREEVIGRNCRFLQHGNGTGARDRSAIDEVRTKLMTNESVSGAVLRNYRKDGTPFWNELYLTPVCDDQGEVTHFIGVQNDVTKRMEVMSRLRTQADRLRALFDGIPTPVGLLEQQEGRFLQIFGNRHALEALPFGVHAHDAPGSIEWEEDGAAKWVAALRKSARMRKPVQFEVTLDNGARIFEVIVNALSPGPDSTPQFFYMAHDVSAGRALEQDVIQIQSRELRRVAQALHDGVGSTLVGATMLSSNLASEIAEKCDEEDVTRDAKQLSKLLARSLDEIRRVSLGLEPVDFDRIGLAGALERLCQDTEVLFAITLVLEVPSTGLPDFDEATSLHLYRVAQEAVTNAVRHGKADHVEVHLSVTGSTLLLEILDNGSGLPDAPLTTSHGMGLRTIQYRTRAIDGELRLGASDIGGARVAVSMPIARKALENIPV